MTSTPTAGARACSCRSCTEQLSRKGDRLYARLRDGERAVDVVYRRTDEDRLQDDAGRLSPRRAAPRAPPAAVNAFGTGVADDHLLHM